MSSNARAVACVRATYVVHARGVLLMGEKNFIRVGRMSCPGISDVWRGGRVRTPAVLNSFFRRVTEYVPYCTYHVRRGSVHFSLSLIHI